MVESALHVQLIIDNEWDKLERPYFSISSSVTCAMMQITPQQIS